MATNTISAANSVSLRETGGFAIPMVLYLDAMSVYAAVTAVFIKIPADSSVLCYLQYLRELLDNEVLFALAWVDTRDMLADGMTKGAIDRQDIHDCMSGQLRDTHEMKIWRPKKSPAGEVQPFQAEVAGTCAAI